MSRSAPSPASGPSVLLLGGCGFVGRHLVALLVQQGVGRIRVVDKLVPAMALLSPDLKEAFAAPAVEHRQADISRQSGVDKAFEGGGFDVVFNLTYDSITYGLEDDVYKQRIVDVATLCGMAAERQGVRRFVDLSTAQVYDSSEKASTESATLKPWTKQALLKLRAESILREIPGLPLVVLRTASMYGPGDVNGLSPRVLCAAVYKYLGEKMRFAWDRKLKTNTVHVRDVAAACWHVCLLASPAPVYNLADATDASQGHLAAVLEEIFGISTSFAGNMASCAMTILGLRFVAEEFNEKHMVAWKDMCKAAGVGDTILTPYIDAELLAHNHLCVDGHEIETTGFAYKCPRLTAATLREQVATYIAQGVFPPIEAMRCVRVD